MHIFFYCFIWGIKCYMPLYFKTKIPDPVQHATPQKLLANNNTQILPDLRCPQIPTRLNTFGTSWTDVFAAE